MKGKNSRVKLRTDMLWGFVAVEGDAGVCLESSGVEADSLHVGTDVSVENDHRVRPEHDSVTRGVCADGKICEKIFKI